MIQSRLGKRTAALATAALVTTVSIPLFAMPDDAYAADETRTYTWADGENRPNIPDSIQVNGTTYTLKSTSNPVQAGGNGQSVSQQFTQTVDSTTGDINNLAGSVPSSLHIDDNGFIGDIPRTGINYTPIYRTDNKHLDETRTYTVTNRNEGSVPQTITANGHNYALTGVSFADGQKDSQGNTLTYIATATYGTDYSEQVLDHYNVSASYSGTLTKRAQAGSWSMSAIYSSPDQNENTNENESAGVTSSFDETTGTFGEPTNLTANEEVNKNSSNPFENKNTNSSDNSGTTETKNNNENDIAETSVGTSLPILPIVAGVVGVAAIAAIIVLLAKKRKKSNQNDDGTNNIVDPNAYASGAVAGGVVAGMGNPEVTAQEPQAQLIELIPVTNENGEIEAEQQPKANLTMDISPAENIPTVIYFPPVVDENGERHEFVPSENDSQFWVAIEPDAVANAVSDDVIVSTDDGYQIYRGKMDTQFQLDKDETVAIVNGTSQNLDAFDIQDELDKYDIMRADYQQPTQINQEQFDELNDNSQDINSNEFIDEPYLQDDTFNQGMQDSSFLDDSGFEDESFDDNPFNSDEYNYAPVDEDEADAIKPSDFDSESMDEFDDAATTQFESVNDDDDNDFDDLLNDIK